MGLGIGKWWKQMKATYGEMSPSEAFRAGKGDGKNLTMQVKFKKMEEKEKRKAARRMRKLS